MGRSDAIEQALRRAFDVLVGPDTPPRLGAAMRHAVFGGGARLRPRLVLSVATACGGADREMAEQVGAAVELLHCASLVHDDLPCFDDAPMRRGRPTVHAEYGEALAVLAGDGLIVGAFEVVSRVGAGRYPDTASRLVSVLASLVGARRGLVAGQAWESEARVELRRYHRAKTGALFEACVRAGAIVGGGDPDAWAPLGQQFGEAYQVADDVLDQTGSPGQLGKPVGRDVVLGRPSAVVELGVAGAVDRLSALMTSMQSAVPSCPGEAVFARWLADACARVFGALTASGESLSAADRGSTLTA